MPTNIRRIKSFSLDLRHVDEKLPISTWVSLSCCCWRVDWNCSNAYRSCTNTIQNTLNNIWNQLKVLSTHKNKINRAGNSDEWHTQNCPPQNCPPKGISRAGKSDIHHVEKEMWRTFVAATDPVVDQRSRKKGIQNICSNTSKCGVIPGNTLKICLDK